MLTSVRVPPEFKIAEAGKMEKSKRRYKEKTKILQEDTMIFVKK
jgi:hypothetical protein